MRESLRKGIKKSLQHSSLSRMQPTALTGKKAVKTVHVCMCLTASNCHKYTPHDRRL